MADSKKLKRLRAYDWSSEKDFPVGPDSQNKHIFYRHPCQKVIWVEGKIGPEFKFACYSCQPDNSLFVSAKKATLLNNEAQCSKLKQTFSNIVVLCLRQNFFVER